MKIKHYLSLPILLTSIFLTVNSANAKFVSPHYDVNGNVTMLTNGEGEVIERTEYDAFGQVIDRVQYEEGSDGEKTIEQKGGQIPDSYANIGFSTKYYDKETGLSYYGYRHYSAKHGRWLNKDPIEEEGGVNLYVFANNSSINEYDIVGLAWYDWVPVVGTIVHTIKTPKGTKATDYSPPKPSKRDCCNSDLKEIAIRKCIKSLKSSTFGYVSDWLGVPMASDATKTVAAVAAGMVRQAGIKYGTRAAVAGTWTAGVLLGDAVIDAAIVAGKVTMITGGYNKAKSEYCVCPPKK